MPFYSTMAIIATADNVSANYATNTWWCEADDLTALQSFHDTLVTFYQSVDTYFSDLTRATNGLELTSYLRIDPEPRPPVLTTIASLTPVGGAPLPPEVSLCMSFQGERMAGVPQSRRRGRIYLPFFGEGANATDGRPVNTMIANVVSAGDAVLTASSAAADWTWVVYSAVEPGYTVITNGWVDNEWDTQRRRGRDATVRSTFE